MRPVVAKLLKQIRKRFPNAEVEQVRHAYQVAVELHQGQFRLSGEEYVTHCIEVAQILANLGLDPVTIAGGLLHDVLEDTAMTKTQMANAFGEDLANLVDGVTKISHLHLPSEQALTKEAKQAQNLRKMLVATAKDVRVILIKLADRLHNMRTLEFLPEEKRRRISRETLEIYAPLAHRLGISTWKWELEDHAFHYLMPSEYKQIAARVAMKRREREAYLNECIAFLQQRLTESEVVARVIGRPKHLYSIYQKMVRQGKDFDQVMDIEGLRIITQTVSGCYNALGSVHSIWTPIPGRFKDYIAMPKLNMYQAIHTTVMREGGKPLEIQIRTEDMDRTAREGIAAHWVYKEGSRPKDQRLDEQLQWLRQMYEWLQEAHAPDELMETVRRDFNVSHVYVFTPKGEVKELPMGATPLDFAYAVHSHIGHHCIGARVNDRMVPLRYNLQTGDIVEILTSKNQHPHKDWVDVVVTGRARTKIRQKLREIGELEPADPVELKTKPREPRTEARTEVRREARVVRPPRPVRLVDDATRQKLIRIQGAKGMHTQFAKCCNPMPGHAVLGYVTKSCVITVHRADCKHFAKSQRDADRIVAAGWEGEGHFETGVRVVIGARPNVLADITNALRPLNIDITKARFEPGTEGKSYFDFIFDADDERGIDRVVRTLNMVQGVTEVQTLEVRELEARQLADVG